MVGRPFEKGSAPKPPPRSGPNRFTKLMKDIIEGALEDLGGQKWLVRQAREHPQAFMQLLGKIIPRDIKLEGKVTYALEELVAGSYDKPAANDERDIPPSDRPH